MSTQLPEIKYEIGQKVWYGCSRSSKEHHPCPDCLGTGKWDVKSPAGTEAKVSCPRCHGSAKLSLYAHAPRVQELTIGSIQVDTNKKVETEPYLQDPVQYMCLETGVGSGSIYYQQTLFLTEEDAQIFAEVQAAEANHRLDERQPERAVLRDLYECQILDAKTKKAEQEARDRKWKWSRLVDSICELDTFICAGGRYENISCSLTDQQVEAVQKSLVWLCDDASDRYDTYMEDKEQEA